MWLRLLIIFLLFGLLGILQTSFLVHFNIIMRITLNLIFILFFLISFFEESQKYIQGIFSAITAGFFLDTFSLFYFGVSFAPLLVIVFLLKYILYLLEKKRDKYPIIYFTNLFVASFIIYNLFLTITIYFLNPPQLMPVLSWIFLIEIAYNLIFALFGFYVYKKFKLYGFL